MTFDPYDLLTEVIDRAGHAPDGIQALKDIALLVLGWHGPRLAWVTDQVTRDPETGELLWSAAIVCACGAGEYPCLKRRQIARILGVEEADSCPG